MSRVAVVRMPAPRVGAGTAGCCSQQRRDLTYRHRIEERDRRSLACLFITTKFHENRLIFARKYYQIGQESSAVSVKQSVVTATCEMSFYRQVLDRNMGRLHYFKK